MNWSLLVSPCASRNHLSNNIDLTLYSSCVFNGSLVTVHDNELSSNLITATSCHFIHVQIYSFMWTQPQRCLVTTSFLKLVYIYFTCASRNRYSNNIDFHKIFYFENLYHNFVIVQTTHMYCYHDIIHGFNLSYRICQRSSQTSASSQMTCATI